MSDEELFGIGLLKLAEGLRMSATGADDWSPERVLRVASYLKRRLDTWSPSKDCHEAYDNAVRVLVSAALAEVVRRALEERVRVLERKVDSLETQVRCGF